MDTINPTDPNAILLNMNALTIADLKTVIEIARELLADKLEVEKKIEAEAKKVQREAEKKARHLARTAQKISALRAQMIALGADPASFEPLPDDATSAASEDIAAE